MSLPTKTSVTKFLEESSELATTFTLEEQAQTAVRTLMRVVENLMNIPELDLLDGEVVDELGKSVAVHTAAVSGLYKSIVRDGIEEVVIPRQ